MERGGRRWQLAVARLVVILSAAAAMTGGGRWARLARAQKRPASYVFYLHNRVYDPAVNNTDDFTVAYGQRPPGYAGFSHPYMFGIMATMEAPLTVGPANTSTGAGWARGVYVYDSRNRFSALNVVTADVDDGTYVGSLNLVGQIDEALAIRTLTVVSGTGDFSLARGVVYNRRVSLVSQPPPAYWTLAFHCTLFYPDV